MHNIYYLGISGERSLPFGLLVLIKGHNAKIDATKTNHQIDIMHGPFEFKLSRYFNTAKISVST